MRCDQIIGLNEWARNFIAGEHVFLYSEITIRTYPDGTVDHIGPIRIYGSEIKRELSGEYYEGMSDDQYLLHKYIFPDGRIFFEKVQHQTLASGAVILLALADEAGEWVKESLWDIEDYFEGYAEELVH